MITMVVYRKPAARFTRATTGGVRSGRVTKRRGTARDPRRNLMLQAYNSYGNGYANNGYSSGYSSGASSRTLSRASSHGSPRGSPRRGSNAASFQAALAKYLRNNPDINRALKSKSVNRLPSSPRRRR
jgi:hypothetical protein